MIQVSRIVAVAALGIAFSASWTPRPAEAACQLIKATHSAGSQAEAAEMSRALALQSANDLKRAKGWNNVSLTARKVKGDPFWKAVRPDGVPRACSIEAGHRHFALLHHLLHRRGRAVRLHDRLKRLRTIRSKLTHPYRGEAGEPLALFGAGATTFHNIDAQRAPTEADADPKKKPRFRQLRKPPTLSLCRPRMRAQDRFVWPSALRPGLILMIHFFRCQLANYNAQSI